MRGACSLYSGSTSAPRDRTWDGSRGWSVGTANTNKSGLWGRSGLREKAVGKVTKVVKARVTKDGHTKEQVPKGTGVSGGSWIEEENTTLPHG